MQEAILMKRNDGVPKYMSRVISKVQIEYTQDGTTWLRYKDGQMLNTGQLESDDATV